MDIQQQRIIVSEASFLLCSMAAIFAILYIYIYEKSLNLKCKEYRDCLKRKRDKIRI